MNRTLFVFQVLQTRGVYVKYLLLQNFVCVSSSSDERRLREVFTTALYLVYNASLVTACWFFFLVTCGYFLVSFYKQSCIHVYLQSCVSNSDMIYTVQISLKMKLTDVQLHVTSHSRIYLVMYKL